ncbi:hypothetical protein [Ligilactobacillus salitolerans]|uniref:hypothetical protein n=1 Tax=Ligilactobacillus salitolerans TaxID=1808352 RepID=UPI001E5B31E8|nr:hypothetical protein [Ligilactobacillus salitolerans]
MQKNKAITASPLFSGWRLFDAVACLYQKMVSLSANLHLFARNMVSLPANLHLFARNMVSLPANLHLFAQNMVSLPANLQNLSSP